MRAEFLAKAVEIAKDSSFVKFDESMDLAIRLGVDPRHADQNVRGTVALPHGSGKVVRVVVFAKPGTPPAEAAQEAGATHLILDERPGSGSVLVAVAVRAGSALETPETRGLTHMLEHLLFDGSERFTREEISGWADDNGVFLRINGLDSIEDVHDIVFCASYLVMGLGDVYLGAPVATPLDPRHRLVTTKYNPARTWTPENAVGIGGSYLCVYGMEGPGGYQFVGRTLQMWNRWRKTPEFKQPWLLRFFDQIRFFPVGEQELLDIRERFPRGGYRLARPASEIRASEVLEAVDETVSALHKGAGAKGAVGGADLQSR